MRFYVLHIYVLPALVVLLLSVHIWRVRKDGFAVADREDAGPGEADRAPEDQEGVSIDA